MKIVGDSIQEGTPTPEEPKEIKHEPKIVIHTIDGEEIMIPIAKEFELKEGELFFKSQKDDKWYLKRNNKMSEDEIIKIIQDDIDYRLSDLCEYDERKEAQAEQGLIELYQKEKEKNREFFNGEKFTRKQIEIVQKAIKEGIEEQVPKEMKNFISKNTIRELIKNKVYTDTYNFKTIAVKDILELLED